MIRTILIGVVLAFVLGDCGNDAGIESSQHLAATVTLKPAHGCTIAVPKSARA